MVTIALRNLLDALVRESLSRLGPPGGGAFEGPALLTRKQAADYLAVGTTTLAELREAGEIKSVLVRGMPRYTRVELDRYVRKLQKDAQ